MTLTEFLLARFADDDTDLAANGKPVPSWWRRAGRRPFLALTPDWLKRTMAEHRADHPDYRQEWKP